MSSSNTIGLEAAKCIATKNLISVFGNVEIAQIYCKQHYEKSDRFQRSA